MNSEIEDRTEKTRDIDADIVLVSFIGDALALGPHWVYDQDEIRSKIGRVTSYYAPLSTYHPGKSAGDFTHYGDQTLILLQSIAEDGAFDPERFYARWQDFWEASTNKAYRDGATRQTLEHLQAGIPPERAGSDSHDIAGAARIGPLFLLKWREEDGLIEAIRRQTAFTHPRDEVVASAEFFSRVVLAARAGAPIPGALDSVMSSKMWSGLRGSWLAAARASAASEATDSLALKTYGLNCHTDGAFPGICHLLLRYPKDPVSALIANANAGGDSAARGMILGLVYGAKYPAAALPEEWLSGLNARDKIADLLRQVSKAETLWPGSR